MTTTTQADIAAYLAAKGRGTVGTSIFVGYKPPTPDAVIVVMDYAGAPPEWNHDGSNNVIDNPSVQVWVRGTASGRATAKTLIENCRTDLDGAHGTIVAGGGFYLNIFAIQSAATSMGTDENGRPEFACNFSTKKRR